MFNKVAFGVVLGITTRAVMEFYVRLKEVDEFGRMSYEDAARMVQNGEGTVSQHERLTRLSIDTLHAASDARQLAASRQIPEGVRTLDPRNPEDRKLLMEMLGQEENSQIGQYL